MKEKSTENSKNLESDSNRKQKLTEYKEVLKSDVKKFDAFMAGPASELAKYTGQKLNSEQEAAMKNFLSASQQLVKTIPKKNGGIANKAPASWHTTLDVCWDVIMIGLMIASL